jgi:hypothetical protein
MITTKYLYYEDLRTGCPHHSNSCIPYFIELNSTGGITGWPSSRGPSPPACVQTLVCIYDGMTHPNLSIRIVVFS